MPQKTLYGGLCHPMDLIIWFLGFPSTVQAIAHESGIDERYPSGEGHFNDNWMVNLIYEDGRLGRVLGLYGLCHAPDADARPISLRNCRQCSQWTGNFR